MITREEYTKALDTVESYHKQLNLSVVKHSFSTDKTLIRRWSKLTECSTRLANVLMQISAINYPGELICIEDVRRIDFKKSPNAGGKTWTEFEDLRGY